MIKVLVKNGSSQVVAKEIYTGDDTASNATVAVDAAANPALTFLTYTDADPEWDTFEAQAVEATDPRGE